jgi:Ty3 transposon capsid-like protein/Zinc knuckle
MLKTVGSGKTGGKGERKVKVGTNTAVGSQQGSDRESVEENEEDEEIATDSIPMNVVQELMKQQQAQFMEQMQLLLNQKQKEETTGGEGRLPGLEKLHEFKGETDSDELDNWLRKLEKHCNYYSLAGSLNTDRKKLEYAIAHLTGGAQDWWTGTKGEIGTYTAFKVAVNRRFRSIVDADKAAEELYDIKQKEGQVVTAYTDRFQQLLIRVPDMAEADRVRLFQRGLHAQLQQKVKENRPVKLEEAITLAIRLEGTMGRGKYERAGGGRAGLNSVEQQEGGREEGCEKQPNTGVEEIIAAVMKEMNKRSTYSRTPGAGAGAGERKTYCFKCGDPRHMSHSCPLTVSVCYRCKKPGHQRKQCPTPPKGKQMGEQEK